ncbi:MAG: YdcF family protein [Cyanophyceae cyanobacterium]
MKLTRDIMVLLGIVLLAVLMLGSGVALVITVTRYQVPEPEAVLVLGGTPERTKFAAQFYQSHPSLEIWISDYQHYEINQQIVRDYGIPAQQVHYDLGATDTITNFTCTLEEFKQHNLRHLYLITADFHMARSLAIATLIFGSQGIIVTPVPISTPEPRESWWLILRDVLRALVWLVTGWSGASLNPNLSLILTQRQNVLSILNI